MSYYDDEKKREQKYRAVEAMYHKGYSAEEIARQLGLSLLETYDMMQKVYALLQRKHRRETF